MSGRRRIVIVVLALVAATTQILLWLTRPRPEPEPFRGPPRSGYALETFTLHALDDQGKLAMTVSGPRLVRGAEDGSIFVTTPDYVLVDNDGNPWIGTSQSAWVNRDGSTMRLEGDVRMRRTPTPTLKPATIETADLTIHPKARTLATDAPARITQPGSILSGTGLRGDLNTRTMEFLSDVQNTFEPNRKRR
ncbi:LPS export ABC transporter periplasmic protein LptC [Dokdonella sp. MW10]|uniref:LPS export ABC transporter periplasmic protein LptC n=1 Tax=Dokdonella sp. MW10 TaxID=2992926 RepID=UPI003F7F35B6